MVATFKPSVLSGTISAPPSKSMAHRFLLGAALSGENCVLSGVDFSEDILATIDCLKALGAKIKIEGDTLSIDQKDFMNKINPILECRESGSTLRFFIPLALCLGTPVTLTGSARLFERPLTVYEELCKENCFEFKKNKTSVTLCGNLKAGSYKVRGDISSQFITGLIFALIFLGEDASVEIIPPFESRSYVELTLSALKSFGAKVGFADEYKIEIQKSKLIPYFGKIEGDYSNAAFLDAFNFIGSDIKIENLKSDSLQGDRVYKDYFKEIAEGSPALDISDCPDLGPILFSLAALKNGATFTGTNRLKEKESDRALAMQTELAKLSGELIIGDNTVTVLKRDLKPAKEPLFGHNDHRIVMALSVILSKIGGEINGAEAVRKSYPAFFNDIKGLGAEVDVK